MCSDCCETISLQGVEVQNNGIIRNSKGYLIGRLVDGVSYDSEHVQGEGKNVLSDLRDQVKILLT